MKIRNNLFLITALCLAIFCLGACSNFEGADGQGSINISFGNSGARLADAYKADLSYKITLTSPGKSPIERETDGSSISIPVSEGVWDIQVDAEGSRVRGEGKESGVVVTTGKSANVSITLTVTGTKVYTWEDLMNDFKDVSLPNEFSVEIIGSTFTVPSFSGNEDNSNANRVITLSSGKTITLRAKTELTIKRQIINSKITTNVFRITNGTLILDGETTITIDGMKNETGFKDCERALINVETVNGKLIMLEGVTLKNNITGNGGGVYVNAGTFEMRGGTITGNTATEKGGGVCIVNDGTFIKTKGIVYGYDEENNSNTCTNRNQNGGGNAVNDNGLLREVTLFENDDWPLN